VEACLADSRHADVFIVGLPHRTLEDDVYKGMFIPKGAIVFVNAWYVQFELAVCLPLESLTRADLKQGNIKRREGLP
jgi:hypothetical protein